MHPATPRLAAALIHAHPGHLDAECAALAAAGVYALHIDLCDGRFGPGLGMGLGAVEAARSAGIPVEAHCLLEDPAPQVAPLVAAGCKVIVVHVEACPHVHRVLGMIRDAGASPAVAILPATPLTKLSYVLGAVDQILLLGAEPGAAPRVVAGSVFERVRILRENLDYLGNPALLCVEGGMTAENAARFTRMGARGLVLDNAAFFAARGQDHAKALGAFRAALSVQAQRV